MDMDKVKEVTQQMLSDRMKRWEKEAIELTVESKWALFGEVVAEASRFVKSGFQGKPDMASLDKIIVLSIRALVELNLPD